MTDPLTASVLVGLAIQKFVESGSGELAKKFTGDAIAKIPILWGKIKTKLTGKSAKVDEALTKMEAGDQSAIQTVTKNLDVVLDEDPDFAVELQILAREIQAGELLQVGLADFEAGELEADIAQQIKRQLSINASQIGATTLVNGVNTDDTYTGNWDIMTAPPVRTSAALRQ